MKGAQKKHKFNVVDALIIIVIAAAIGAAVFFFRPDANAADEQQTTAVNIEYVIQLSTVRDEFADNFNIGDKVIDGVALYEIGEIVAVDVTDAVYSGTNLQTGEIVLSDYPEHSNVELTISAKASIGELGRYSIDGYDLAVGSLVSIRTRSYTGTACCTQIRVSEGALQ